MPLRRFDGNFDASLNEQERHSLFIEMAPTVVCLAIVDEFETKHATGVLIDGEGYLLTLSELVSKKAKITAVLRGGGYEAKIWENEELKRKNLALLKIEAKEHEWANISKEDIFVGKDIFCIQNSKNDLGFQTSYVCSDLKKFKDIQSGLGAGSFHCDEDTDLILTVGMSLPKPAKGAPFFDAKGNVMGLLAFGYEYYAFAIRPQEEKIFSALNEAKRNGF